jgi:hypothetical protein
MSEEEIWAALEAWRDSDEYKQIERIFEIYEQAERAYQLALVPVHTYTTDNTNRPWVTARSCWGG